MGAYLSAPVTDKQLCSGTGRNYVYAVGSMQGWRRTMEDSHLTLTDVPDGSDTVGLFGVFDGHGGAEVAKFCSKHLADQVFKLEEYKQGKVEDSLIKVFHKMDEMLRDHKYICEIEDLKRVANGVESTSEAAAEDGDPVNSTEALQVLRKVMALRKLISENENQDDLAEAIFSDATEEQVIEPLPEDKIQSGCTAVVAVLKGSDLVVANAGDSRAVLSRAGKAIALSEDHKPFQPSERSRIQQAGGFLTEIGGICRVNGNLNLSRAIGDLKYKTNGQLEPKDQIITAQPDVTRTSLQPEDQFFVLACDGVWDVMDNQEVVDFVCARLQTGLEPTEIISQLLDHCLAKDPQETRGVGCDNMTAAVVIFKN